MQHPAGKEVKPTFITGKCYSCEKVKDVAKQYKHGMTHVFYCKECIVSIEDRARQILVNKDKLIPKQESEEVKPDPELVERRDEILKALSD